eukprot:1159237-Pelagomonas_calceolata.AAC.3
MHGGAPAGAPDAKAMHAWFIQNSIQASTATTRGKKDAMQGGALCKRAQCQMRARLIGGTRNRGRIHR